MAFTTEQLGRLLMKHRRKEPRRNLKRWLKDCGGAGSAEELDEVLAAALKTKPAIAEADRLEKAHLAELDRTEQHGLAGVADMITQVQQAQQAAGINQEQLATMVNATQPQVSEYVTGKVIPGGLMLARIAAALGKRWELVDDTRTEG